MATTRHNNTEHKPETNPAHGSGTTKLHDHFELVLNWYKTNNRNLAGEEVVTNLHIKKLMSILGNPIWNQIYHCWQIELKHVAELQPYISHQLDPTKYVYFIEAYNNH